MIDSAWSVRAALQQLLPRLILRRPIEQGDICPIRHATATDCTGSRTGGTLHAERGISSRIIEELTRRGHRIETVMRRLRNCDSPPSLQDRHPFRFA